jgi:hypothetical protein
MPALEFVERAKDTARRNGQLLLRLAHFTPRPLRAYAQPTHSPSQRVGAGGWVPSTSNPANPTQLTPAPQASTSPERERVGPASTNPTLQRGPTDAAKAHPTPDNHARPHLPASTNPERERESVSTALPTIAPTPVPLSISAQSTPRSELRTPSSQRGPPQPCS